VHQGRQKEPLEVMTTAKETQPTVRSPLEKQLDLVVTQAGPRSKGKAFLMVSTGEAAGTVWPVTQPSLLIGRSLEAQIRMNEQAVSYEHARLDQTPDGYTLRDLGSTNGTYVNGQRLVDTVVLVGGDSVRLGSTTFTFVTRESGFPKGTVKLTNPNPDLPIEPRRSRAAPDSMAMTAMPESRQQQHTGSISLTDAVRTVKTYWVYVRRYGWIAAVCTVFGLAVGMTQAWLRPPPGTAWFEITLAGSGRNNGSQEEEGPQVFVGAESTFRSLPLIKRTLAELGAPNASDAAATNIQGALSFERVSFNSQVWHAQYEDATADLAVRFLNKHVQVYVDSELDKLLKVLRMDAEFDREQEELGATRVAEARNKLIEFSDEHPDAVPKDAKLPDQPRARLAPNASPERIKQSIATTERALRTAYTNIQAKKARPYLEQAAAAEGKIAEARARGLRDQHPEVRSLLNLQASMRARAGTLLAAEPSPTEQSLDPEVVRLKEEISELQARLSQTQAAAPAGAATAATSTAPAGAEPEIHIAPITKAAEDAQGESLAQLKIYYGELAREYERAKTEHEALLKKRETTDRQLDRERTSAEARYSIITPPTPANKSVLSALVKRGAMGGMLGLGLALVAAACLELRRTLIARGHI
jgi:pSer/pThr/pTyr-binding forkhead associated (FHA) protein